MILIRPRLSTRDRGEVNSARVPLKFKVPEDEDNDRHHAEENGKGARLDSRRADGRMAGCFFFCFFCMFFSSVLSPKATLEKQ
jgi:hypothetical protein